jgi:uncharacterized protein YegL
MVDYDKHDVSPYAEIDEKFGATSPDSTGTRRLLVSMLDLSDSMNTDYSHGKDAGPTPVGERPIDELNAALHSYVLDELDQDPEFRRNGEIAVGGFYGNNTVEWMKLGIPVHADSNFYWTRYVSAEMRESEESDPFELEAGGGTPLGHAVNAAIDLIEGERTGWRDGIRTAHRPIIVVFTDGAPTDMFDGNSTRLQTHFQSAINRVHQLEGSKELLFWIACTRGANTEALLALANKGNLIPLGGKKISSFITLMQMSPTAASAGGSRPAEEVYADLRRKWNRDDS